ncbi:unnamed protein product [Rotaria sp. Silwood1]|nr:unnamed protein product [Rotaria sp. Silwood1]
MLAIYVNIPTDEALLYRQVCYKLYNISLCNSINEIKTNKTYIYENMEDIIQKYASIYVMYFNFIYSIPSIFIAIICGIWSDKYSHKIPMIFASIGCILSTIVNLFVSIIKYNLSLEILFLSNLFLSLFGSTSTMFSIIYNYISHITTIENRTQRIAIIESCLMFGSTIGLILSGILIDLTNFQYCFLFIIFIHFINIIYIIFYVKEVIHPNENIKLYKNFYEILFFCNDIKDSCRVLFKQREVNQRRYLLLALFGLLCSITPYGYSNNDPPNYQQHVSAAQAGANAIKGVNSKRTYEIGGIADVLYIATGSTVDWAYDDLKIPYSYTIELPPSRTESSVGFVLPPDQAPGVCHETYVGMKAFLVEVKKGVTGASTG